jgi:hypothetical protein
MDNDKDKESSLGLMLLLTVGYCYQIAGWFSFIRNRSIKRVKIKGSARRSGLLVRRDGVERSDVVADSGR